MDAAALALGYGYPIASAQQKTKIQTQVCAIIGRPSLWVLSLGRSRESTSAVRPRTDLRSGIAIATQIKRKKRRTSIDHHPPTPSCEEGD